MGNKTLQVIKNKNVWCFVLIKQRERKSDDKLGRDIMEWNESMQWVTQQKILCKGNYE